MASIVATPEPGFSPPRMRLDVSADGGATLQSVSVTRGGRRLRQATFPGGATAVAYDYEMPYGVPVTYEATGTTVGAFTTEWSESWANLSAWTGDVGLWSVSSGEARTTEHDRSITRTASQDIGKVTLSGTPEWIAVDLLSATGATVATIEYLTGYASVRLKAGTQSVPSGLAGGPASVSISGSRVTVQGTAGWRLSLPSTTPVRRVRLRSLVFNQGGTAKIGAVAVAPSPTSAGFTATVTAAVAAEGAWLVHPVQPAGRSVCIGESQWRPDGINIDPSSMSSASRTSNTVLLRPVGRAGAVAIGEGIRSRSAWPLVLLTHTLEHLDQLNSILDDGQVLLLRSPAGWRWGHPDGWYAVGDTSEDRIVENVLAPDRRVTLPLEAAEEPVVQQQPAWSWADVYLNYETWSDVMAAYPTWSALLAGPQ